MQIMRRSLAATMVALAAIAVIAPLGTRVTGNDTAGTRVTSMTQNSVPASAGNDMLYNSVPQATEEDMLYN